LSTDKLSVSFGSMQIVGVKPLNQNFSMYQEGSMQP
jgi:hypothetical protein